MMKSIFLALLTLWAVSPAFAGLTVIGDDTREDAPPKSLQEAIRPEASINTWRSKPGTTLKDTLQDWAKLAKWNLMWSVVDGEDDINYPLPTPVEFQGSFDQVAARFVRLYQGAKVPLHADIDLQGKVIYITAEKKR